jgi:DNA-binding IclR family transcriptional regulator
MATVQSVVRAFSVLEVLSAGPAGVSDISAQTELPKSTVSRLLSTLERIGAVDRLTEGTNYRLGSGLIEILGTSGAPKTLGRSVHPHLEQLAAKSGEAAGLAVPDSYSVQYVTQVESPEPVQVRDYSGLSLPMHVGPSGLAIMSRWPLELLQHYLVRPLEAFTKHTMTDPAQIVERLRRFRADGYGWVYEEFAEGINSVAAPLLDGRNAPIGAIHIHGPAFRFPGDRDPDEIGGWVAEEARRYTVRVDSV